MKVSKLLTTIYTILFILIMFPGAELDRGGFWLFQMAAELFVLLCLVYIAGWIFCKKYFYLTVDKIYFIWVITMLVYITYSYFTYSYDPVATKPYVLRYIFFSVAMLFTICPEQILKIYDLAEIYVLAVDIVFVLQYPLKGVNGSFLGSYQNVATVSSLVLIKKMIDIFTQKAFKIRDILEISFILLALVMTGKRSFLLIPFVIFFVFMLANKSNKVRKRIIYLALFLACGGVIVLMLKPDLLYSFTRLLETSSDDSLSGRKWFWDLCMYLWDENKITGIGMGTYTSFIKENLDFCFRNFKVQVAYAPHNIYYQLLSETGTIGFIIWVSFFVYSFIATLMLARKTWVKENPSYKKIMSLAIAYEIWFLMYGLSGNPLSIVGQTYTFLFAVMMGQSVKRDRLRREACN